MCRKIAVWICFFLLLLIAGCPPPHASGPSGPVCPGRKSIDEAAGALSLQRANLPPLRASADCILELEGPDGKMKKERFEPQLRFVPPDRLYFKGDKFGVIWLGTNEEAFWAMVKPELDSYWWGTRAAAEQCVEKLQFNPWNITEALGAAQVDASWALDYEKGYDIVSRTDPETGITKTLRIRACDYLIESIETTGTDGQTVRIRLDQYTAPEPGLLVPTVIDAEHVTDGRVDASMQVRLRGVRRFEYNPSMEGLFDRPSSENFENVWRLAPGCEFFRITE